MRSHHFLTQIVIMLLLAARLSADVVETKGGTRIVGRITKIDAGSVFISTADVGDLTIKQSVVAAIVTDGLWTVRLSNGTRVDGQITSQRGMLEIVGAGGVTETTVHDVAAIWATGQKDPALVALEHHWKYEASVDVNGTTGNHEQLGTAAGFTAKLVMPQSSLILLAAYNRQVTDGVRSADQFKAGADYTDNFAARYSWFLRDEAGFDRVMDIKTYDTAAVGIGYDFIKNPIDQLTGRVGLAYRYASYNHATTPTVNSAAADFELANDLKIHNWELVNKLAVVPAFSDFKNVIVTQDSYFQIPLADPSWKLRMGVSNNYQSMPPPAIKRLDTTYYTRLILDFQ